MELLKMRGKDCLASETSRRLALAVRTQMVSTLPQLWALADVVQTFDRIIRSRPLDDFFQDKLHLIFFGTSEAMADRDLPLTNPLFSLTNMSFQIPTLRYHTLTVLQQSNTPSAIPSVLDLIRRCRSLDTALAAWPSTLSSDWKYTTSSFSVPSPPPSPSSSFPSYPGATHTYYDIWVANVWNSYRIYRLMINACIIRCCAWLVAGSPVDIHLDTTHPEIGMMPEYAEARRNLLDMFNGVCASVQFCLGSGLKHTRSHPRTAAPPLAR